MDAAIARQRPTKQVSAATSTDATIKDAAFSMLSGPRLCNETQLEEGEAQQQF
jgi:hypothetical protein